MITPKHATKNPGENRSCEIISQYFYSREGPELAFLLWIHPLCDLEQSLDHSWHQLLNLKMKIQSMLSLHGAIQTKK